MRTSPAGASLTLATAIEKVSVTAAALASRAVMAISRVPTSALPGVPEKVPVAGSKRSQAGRSAPSARVAERVRVSPVSTSAKVPAGTVKAKAWSWVAARSGRASRTTGASLTLATTSEKVLCAVAPPWSRAVTVTATVPTSVAPGVPEKVPVVASKRSQPGRLPPSARAAESVRVSSASTSAKVPAGTAKAKAWSCVASWPASAAATCGASFTSATTRLSALTAVDPSAERASTNTVRKPSEVSRSMRAATVISPVAASMANSPAV